MLTFALRMTLRDWRAGELRFLLLALALAVASLSAIHFFTDRMGTGLRRDAHQLLGADLRVVSDGLPDPAWRSEASRRGLQTAVTIETPSMASSGEGDATVSQMAALKSASSAYPLRGALSLDGAAVRGLPAPGSAWVEARLNQPRASTIRLGERQFVVAGIVTAEPDRGPSMLAFSPRVLIGEADMAATGLIQAGSFATHALLVAGEPRAVAGFESWLKAALEKTRRKGVKIETLATSAAALTLALERAQRFLALVGMLSALLASVAIAMAARRYTLRHADASAMLRCLGLTQRRIMAMYLIEFTLVGLAGSLLGVLCGFSAHFALVHWLGALVTSELPPASWLPVASGLGVGTLLLLGFGLPPLLGLRKVSHNRLLRREAQLPQPLTLAAWGSGLAMFGALLLWQSGDLETGLLTGAAFVLGLALFFLAGWGFVAALRLAPRALERGVWRLALNDLRRRPGATITQVVALALGLMALLLLTVVRGDLLAAWKDSAPPDAPNHILFNISASQRDAAALRLRQFGQPTLYPRIVAQVVSVNGQPVSHAGQNVSAAAQLPAGEQLVSGAWPASGNAWLSVTDETATRFKLKLGDRIGFDMAGRSVEAAITSLRKSDPRAYRAGFAWILSPAAVEGLPMTYVAALRVPRGGEVAMARFTSDFPTVTVFNTGAMIGMLRRVLDQVSAAVEFLFLFTLASGVFVLYASLAATQDERMRQSALLRALGASRAQLARSQWIEHALVGSLAGLLAAAGASGASWALARFAFKLPWQLSPQLWAAGLAAGVLCALVGGWAGLRAVLNHPPLQILRS